MKRMFQITNRNPIIPAAAAAVLTLGLTAAPVSGVAAKEPEQTAAQDQGPIDEFTAWAKEQVTALDKQLEEVTAEAGKLGAEASDEAKQQWQEARDAIAAQRKELAKQVDDLQSATKSEWKDAKAATKQALDDLGRQIDDFRKKIGGGKSGG